MKILPTSTLPWPVPIVRRHTPPSVSGDIGYRVYLTCLRWDFGFSCAFCMIHESDAGTLFGRDFMQIEHFVLKSQAEEMRNVYANLFYICRDCNVRRGRKSNWLDSGDVRLELLNPCERVWADVFELKEDRLRPLDENSEFTEITYALNHFKKVAFRRDRREAISESLAVLDAIAGGWLNDIMRKFDEHPNLELLNAASALRAAFKAARRELSHRSAIPNGVSSCDFCRVLPDRSLPEALDLQVTDIDLPDI